MSEVRKVDANKKINADLQDYNLDLPVLEKQSETEKIKSIFEKNKDKDSLNKTIYEGFEQTEAAIQRIKDENPLYALGDVTAATVNIANKPLEFVKGWTDEAIDSLRSDNEGINNVGVDGTGKVVKGATGMVTGAVETAGAIFSTEEGSFKRAAGKFADGAVDMGKGTANTVLGILGKGWIWGKTEETEDAPSSDDIAENQSESILAQLAEEANSNKASEEVKKVPETESESITEEPAVQAEEKTEEIQQQNAPKEEEPVAGEPDVETDFVHKEQAEAEEIVVSEEEPAIEEATEEVELTEEPVMAEEPVEEVQDAEEDFFSDELEIDDYLMTSDKVDAFLNNVLKDSVDYKTAVSEVLEKKNDGLIDNEAASKILLAKMYRASISVDDALDTLEKMDDGMGLGIWEKMLIAGKEPGNIDTMPEEYAGIKDCSENDFISGFKSVFSLGKQDSPISEELLPDEEPQATEEAAAVEETVLSEEQVAEEPVMTEEAVIPEEESVTVEETAADEEQTVADMAAVNKNVIEQELLIENNDDLSEDDGADLGTKYVSLVEDLAKYYAHIAEDAPDVELIDAKSIEELKLDMANHYSSLEFNEIDPETDAQLAAYRNLIGFISEHGKPELDEPIVNSVKIEDVEKAALDAEEKTEEISLENVTQETEHVEETVVSEEQVAEEPVMVEETVIPEEEPAAEEPAMSEEPITVDETAADEEQTVAEMAAVNENVIEQELLIENNDDLSEDDGADLGAKYVSLVEDLAKYYAHIAEDAPDVELIDAKSIEELKLDMANHYSSLEFNEIDPETDAQLAAYRNLIGFISEHGKPELDEPIVNSVKIEDAEEARKAEEARLADVTEQVPVTEDKENKLKSILDGFYNALSMSVSFPFGLKNSDESQSAEAEQPAEEPEIVLNNAETPETQAERELVLEEEPAPEEEYAIEDSNDAQNMHVSQPAPLQKIPEAVERSIETREKLQASLGNAYEPFSVSTEAEYVSENIAETEEAPAQNPEPQAEPVPVEEPAISEENVQTEETEAEEPVQNEETVQNEEPVITDDHKESLPGIDIVEEALADVAKMEEDDAEQPAQKEVQISDIISIPAEELGEYEIAAEAEPASQEDLAIAEEQVTVADESAQSEEQVVTEEPAQIEEFVINEKKPESMPGISDVDDALAILAEMEESDVQNTAPQAEQTFTEEPSITEENVQPEEIVAADKPIQAEEIRVVENETSQTGHLAGSEDVADAIAALDEMETENAEQLVQPEEQDVADEPAPAEETPVIEEHVSEAEAAPAEEPVAADGQVQPEEQVVAEETVPAEETVIEEEQPDESVNTTGFEEFNDMIESLGLAAKPESVSDNAQTGLSEKTAALINASQKDSADFETAVPDILKSVELNEINDDDAVQMIFFKMLRADRDNIDLMIYAYEDDLSDKQKAVINKVYNLYDAADKKAYGEEIRALSEEAYIKAVTSKMTPVAADTEEKAPEVALVSEQEYAEPAAEEQIPAAPADDISAVSETPVSSKSDTVKRDAGLSDIEEALALADELDAEPAEKTEEKQVKNAEPAPEEEAEAAPEPLPAEQTPAVQAQVSVKIPVVLDKNALALAGELMKDSADFKDAANTIMDKAETGEISTDSAIELLANKMYREKCDYLRVLIFVGEKGFTPTGEAIIAELEKRTYRADFEEITKNLSSASETDFLKHVEASLYTVGPDEPGPTTEIVSNTLNVDNTQIAAEKSESAPAADEAQVLEPKDTAIAKNMPQTESVEKTEPEETFVQVENQVQPVETIIAKMEQPKVIADENALALVDELMRDSADFDNAVNTIMDKAIAGEITTDSAITLIESKMSRTKSDYLATMISLGPKWYDTSIGISVKDEVKKFCENEDYSVREDFVKMTQNYSSMSETDFLNTVKGENTTVLADNNTESVNTEEEPQLVQNAVSNQQPSFEPEKHVTEEKQIVKTDIQPQYEQPDTEKVSQPEIASVQQALNPEENFENELDNLFVMFKKGEFEEDALTNQVAQAIFDSGMQFDDAIGIVIDKKNEAGLFDSSLVYDLVTKYNFL